MYPGPPSGFKKPVPHAHWPVFHRLAPDSNPTTECLDTLRSCKYALIKRAVSIIGAMKVMQNARFSLPSI
eukprot:176245-Rhodomonas_salina.2